MVNMAQKEEHKGTKLLKGHLLHTAEQQEALYKENSGIRKHSDNLPTISTTYGLK